MHKKIPTRRVFPRPLVLLMILSAAMLLGAVAKHYA